MIYLLDTSMLIYLHRNYYSMDMVPEFWTWCLWEAKNNVIKIPIEIYKEILNGSKGDKLYEWAKKHEQQLILEDTINTKILLKVLQQGYNTPDLTIENMEAKTERLGADPFLIAYAYTDVKNYTIVTDEVSRNATVWFNSKIPDVCKTFNIPCWNAIKFLKELKFSTNWEKTKEKQLSLF